MTTKTDEQAAGKARTGFGIFRKLAPVAVLAASTAAAAQEVTVSHGYSYFGDLKYPANFDHLDYVNPDAPKGGEASVWAEGTFDSFNPYTRKGRAGSLSSSFYDSLLTGTADEIGTAYCYVCTTMEYPSDYSWIVYNMREDVTFWDGSPVTAHDVLFTYELFLAEGLPSYRAVLGQLVAGVEVLDDHRLKVTFTEQSPDRDRIGTIGGLPIFSKKWFEEGGYGLDESRLVQNMGAGPYILDSFEVNQRIVYRRDPNYWGREHPFSVGHYNYDTIRVEYFGDSQAAFEGFKAGAYTFRTENSSKSWATAYDFPAIRDGTIIKTELPDGTIATGQSYAFNLRRQKFQDIRVREAIGMMFNFEWSNETLFFGLYERITSFWENSDLQARGEPSAGEAALLQPLVDEGLLDASILTDEAVMPPVSSARQLDRRALRAASALLDEAGWLVGDDGKRRKGGRTLDVEILSASPAFDRIHNPFVENLQALGVNARMERIDYAQYTNRTREFDFDMITEQFPMGYEPGAGLVQYFGSANDADSVFNSMGLRNPAVDRLIDVVRGAESREDLHISVRALDRVLRAEKFWVPQWYKDVHTVAFYNMYRFPEELPPFALGNLSFWWIDAEREAALKGAGKI